jgi:hypothetical protein
MIVEDHDMSDCLATYGYKLRPDREASLLSSRFGIRQPVGSNPHHSFLKGSKIDISQNVKLRCASRDVIGRAAALVFRLRQVEKPIGNVDALNWHINDMAEARVRKNAVGHHNLC